MISREAVLSNLERYDTSKIKIGVVGSHSALDVCDGSIDEGFRTFVICQKGRERTYIDYFKAHRSPDGKVTRGLVDEGVVLGKFKEMLEPSFMDSMMKDNILFVPNRSFVSYCGIDAVENDFTVPMVGSRNMLRSEERGDDEDYYWILEKAGLPYPKKVNAPEDIDTLTIVKLHHKQKKLERGFFTASTLEEYEVKSKELLRQGVIDEESLKEARMEEYIIGPVFNLDFFYSPLEERGERVELLGIDWRFESSLDGFVRLPAEQQLDLSPDQRIPEYTVCGHNSATLRESLLEKAFELAEKYVATSKEYYDPGIIGPFCLQTCVDKDLKFYIYDVAPRVGGGTNVHLSVGHPYGNALWRQNMSTGRRLALEIKRAIEQERLGEIVT
ncbi:MAG: formate--phosphoribosylaminoimidazolecarboxamide ligase family protein [Methanomassiliicoccales archaeon]|nr:formate--phosphoribosylaminoimidazolecarboxamide ligase family protein [Methanomassiliicoccales archaeon]NYT14723.1 formate--phosphoribosylaminoimidazolecarboxamide ligase family protein [Methanomassiliicoccales archaeon]